MPPPIFAHLHSSPLVVRHQSDSNWRNLSFHSGVNGSLNGYEAVELIDVKAERRLLLQTLRESGRHLSWQSEVAEVHTFRKILSFGCRVLHFSGHGVPGQVIFETRRGEAQFVSQQELQDLILAGGADDRCLSTRQRNRRQEITELCDERSFRSRSDSTSSDSDDATSGLSITSHKVELGRVTLTAPRMQHEKHNVPLKLAFLSACHSESVAEAFVRAGVPHVVVVSKEKKVLDRKAMEFAKAFYTALFAGHAVAKSFEIGRVQADIVVASNGDNAVDGGRSEFKLLGDGDHNDAPFRDVPAGDLIETDMDGRRGGNVTMNECDAIAEVFVGRSMEVHQVYKALVEGARLVSITGERGIGKTEVALQCAQYATERRVFSHIFYLRLNTGNDGKDASDDLCKQHAELELPLLVSKFAKCLGLQAISLDQLAELARQRCEIENQGDGSSFLLILDGCNRAERQNSCFRTIVAMLLRRVNSLALLLTGDGRFGALDGVGEKIISIGPLPLADAALLFTLRAPRKIKAHEMGSSTDLKTFGEHPIIKSLQGHPRTICAVSQLLEKKDMELDQDEFLSYIIPSVNTGLCMSTVGDSATLDCGLDSRQRLHEQKKLALASNNTEGCYSHSHEHHYHHRQHDGMPSCIVEEARDQHRLDSVQKTVIRRMKPVASQSDVVTAKSLLKVPSTQKMTSDDIENQGIDFPPPHVHPLISARSVPSPTGSITAPTTSLQQQCLLQVAEYVRPVIQSEGGSLVWARAVVIRTTFSNHLNFEGRLKSEYLAAMVHQLQGLQDIPLDWIAPQVSYFFATKLKGDAAKRPLSTRSIDFLSKSSLIWGHKSTAPAQRGGAVTLHMFAAFWAWFRPLVDCILHSTLWPHTEPRLLHGLLSKGDCIRMLERAPSGTFLLRFSETRIRCLVIAYVREDLCVQFVPVTWHPERNGWFVALQAEVRKTDDSENNGVTFSTLQELILSVNVLKFLFPQTPKGVAFTLERQMRQEPEAS